MGARAAQSVQAVRLGSESSRPELSFSRAGCGYARICRSETLLMVAPKPRRFGPIVVGLALIVAASPAWSPHAFSQDAAPKAKDEKGKWVPLFQRHANEYEMRV